MNNSKKPDPPLIHVLLASYNGEKYIVPQLNSIGSQSHKYIKITVRDDGSTDQTVKLVKQFQEIHGRDKIEIVVNKSTENGHCRNFSALAERAIEEHSDYFCFSDQDDVWHHDKLELLNARMVELERKHGKSTPILIHSDLTVVDEQLNVIHPSFVQFQNLPSPSTHDYPRFLYQNVVTGCTTLFNRALLEIAAPIPDKAIVHDWWFALCAQQFGLVDFVNRPTSLYRQHGANSIGALSAREQTSFLKKHIYKTLLYYPKHIASAVEQANSLLIVMKNKNNVHCKNFNYINDFSKIKDKSFRERINFVDLLMMGNDSLLQRGYLYFTFFVIKWL